ncbi:methyltransferase-like 23 [Crotalus adamanteus]|uniref:Methyltransferase-like 23 n=1 Tax=Crotalus adamanteus TaxID=8729 RepID=A0AAW1BWT2_CROAD
MCEIASNLTVKEYRFGRDEEKGDRNDQPRELVVMIPEVLDPQYGMYVWPCAVVLAHYIWFHRKLVCGKRVLEIGAGLTWGHVSPSLLTLAPVDLILGSDVFFEPEDFEDVISTVHYLMEKNPHAQFWTTYQVRSANWSIEGLLYKWEMESTCVPLQSFEANKEQLAGSSLPGMHTIQMMVISKKINK